MQNRSQKRKRYEAHKNLAECIREIEARQPQLDNSNVPSLERVALGIEEIDHVLDPYHGKGIEFAALHEIRSATTLAFGAAAGFALVLANHMERSRFQQTARLQPQRARRDIESSHSEPLRPMFWIAEQHSRNEAGEFYGPGLYMLGIDPSRLIRILPRNLEEGIWAAGEVSGSSKTGFGLLEIHGNPHRLDLATTRRLLLRCQKSREPFFILRQSAAAQTSAVSTRWLVEPVLSHDLSHSRFVGNAQWKVTLEKCRGGKTGNWILEWNHYEHIFQIANQSARNRSDQTTMGANAHIGKSARSRQKEYSPRIARKTTAEGATALSGGVVAAISE